MEMNGKLDTSSSAILAPKTWHFDLMEELDGNLRDYQSNYKAFSGERRSPF